MRPGDISIIYCLEDWTALLEAGTVRCGIRHVSILDEQELPSPSPPAISSFPLYMLARSDLPVQLGLVASEPNDSFLAISSCVPPLTSGTQYKIQEISSAAELTSLVAQQRPGARDTVRRAGWSFISVFRMGSNGFKCRAGGQLGPGKGSAKGDAMSRDSCNFRTRLGHRFYGFLVGD